MITFIVIVDVVNCRVIIPDLCPGNTGLAYVEFNLESVIYTTIIILLLNGEFIIREGIYRLENVKGIYKYVV